MKSLLYKFLTCAFIIHLAVTTATAQDALITENIVFPADAGIINATAAPYNAEKTGTTDATAAIQAAIDVAKGNLKDKIVYLPNGTYLVSNKLVFSTDAANHRGMIFQGQSREGTILKLADNTPGAANPAVAFPVIRCVDAPVTFHNSMFNCNIMNLTVDLGTGNPGAVGINFLGNNQSCICNVLVKSSDPVKVGRNGIEFSFSLQGPSFIKNVTVDGFDYGLRTRLLQYGLTFENITLKNQKLAGIRTDAQTLSIRHLLSQNTVPAIQQVAGGQSKGIVTLIDSRLNNGDPANHAIQLDDGWLFARNITTTGYTSAIRNFGTTVPGNNVTEWVNDNARSIFPSPATSLNMTIKETPELPLADTVTWASVRTFGAIPGDAVNDDDAIQAAMNSGAATIYFPNPNNSEAGSRYRISKTITIPGTVKRILGLYTGMYPVGTMITLLPIKPVFRFLNGTAPDTVVMEGVRTASSGARTYLIDQASNRTLVLRNISVRNGWGYRNSGFGDVYMEDFHTLAANVAYDSSLQQPGLIFKNQNVWARQLNPEQNSVNVINDSSKVWILGFKSEYPTTLIETRNGGYTELLGGLTLTVRNAIAPAFINNNSFVSVAGFGEARSRSTNSVYVNAVVTETRNGITDSLVAISLPTRKAEQDASLSFVLPLYTGYSSIILPLQLLSIQAWLVNGVNKEVQVKWITAGEYNMQSFIVERSAGNGFTAVGNIKPTNTPGKHTYTFTDGQPFTGISYYRIKQVDKNGTITYSPVATIRNSTALSLTILNNPATTQLNVLHPAALKGATLKITGIDRRNITQKVVAPGITQTTGWNISQLTTGTYLLIFTNSGENISTKFIKQ